MIIYLLQLFGFDISVTGQTKLGVDSLVALSELKKNFNNNKDDDNSEQQHRTDLINSLYYHPLYSSHLFTSFLSREYWNVYVTPIKKISVDSENAISITLDNKVEAILNLLRLRHINSIRVAFNGKFTTWTITDWEPRSRVIHKLYCITSYLLNGLNSKIYRKGLDIKSLCFIFKVATFSLLPLTVEEYDIKDDVLCIKLRVYQQAPSYTSYIGGYLSSIYSLQDRQKYNKSFYQKLKPLPNTLLLLDGLTATYKIIPIDNNLSLTHLLTKVVKNGKAHDIYITLNQNNAEAAIEFSRIFPTIEISCKLYSPVYKLTQEFFNVIRQEGFINYLNKNWDDTFSLGYVLKCAQDLLNLRSVSKIALLEEAGLYMIGKITNLAAYQAEHNDILEDLDSYRSVFEVSFQTDQTVYRFFFPSIHRWADRVCIKLNLLEIQSSSVALSHRLQHFFSSVQIYLLFPLWTYIQEIQTRYPQYKYLHDTKVGISRESFFDINLSSLIHEIIRPYRFQSSGFIDLFIFNIIHERFTSYNVAYQIFNLMLTISIAPIRLVGSTLSYSSAEQVRKIAETIIRYLNRLFLVINISPKVIFSRNSLIQKSLIRPMLKTARSTRLLYTKFMTVAFNLAFFLFLSDVLTFDEIINESHKVTARSTTFWDTHISLHDLLLVVQYLNDDPIALSIMQKSIANFHRTISNPSYDINVFLNPLFLVLAQKYLFIEVTDAIMKRSPSFTPFRFLFSRLLVTASRVQTNTWTAPFKDRRISVFNKYRSRALKHNHHDNEACIEVFYYSTPTLNSVEHVYSHLLRSPAWPIATLQYVFHSISSLPLLFIDYVQVQVYTAFCQAIVGIPETLYSAQTKGIDHAFKSSLRSAYLYFDNVWDETTSVIGLAREYYMLLFKSKAPTSALLGQLYQHLGTSSIGMGSIHIANHNNFIGALGNTLVKIGNEIVATGLTHIISTIIGQDVYKTTIYHYHCNPNRFEADTFAPHVRSRHPLFKFNSYPISLDGDLKNITSAAPRSLLNIFSSLHLFKIQVYHTSYDKLSRLSCTEGLRLNSLFGLITNLIINNTSKEGKIEYLELVNNQPFSSDLKSRAALNEKYHDRRSSQYMNNLVHAPLINLSFKQNKWKTHSSFYTLFSLEHSLSMEYGYGNVFDTFMLNLTFRKVNGVIPSHLALEPLVKPDPLKTDLSVVNLKTGTNNAPQGLEMTPAPSLEKDNLFHKIKNRVSILELAAQIGYNAISEHMLSVIDPGDTSGQRAGHMANKMKALVLPFVGISRTGFNLLDTLPNYSLSGYFEEIKTVDINTDDFVKTQIKGMVSDYLKVYDMDKDKYDQNKTLKDLYTLSKKIMDNLENIKTVRESFIEILAIMDPIIQITMLPVSTNEATDEELLSIINPNPQQERVLDDSTDQLKRKAIISFKNIPLDVRAPIAALATRIGSHVSLWSRTTSKIITITPALEILCNCLNSNNDAYTSFGFGPRKLKIFSKYDISPNCVTSIRKALPELKEMAISEDKDEKSVEKKFNTYTDYCLPSFIKNDKDRQRFIASVLFNADMSVVEKLEALKKGNCYGFFQAARGKTKVMNNTPYWSLSTNEFLRTPGGDSGVYTMDYDHIFHINNRREPCYINAMCHYFGIERIFINRGNIRSSVESGLGLQCSCTQLGEILKSWVVGEVHSFSYIILDKATSITLHPITKSIVPALSTIWPYVSKLSLDIRISWYYLERSLYATKFFSAHTFYDVSYSDKVDRYMRRRIHANVWSNNQPFLNAFIDTGLIITVTPSYNKSSNILARISHAVLDFIRSFDQFVGVNASR